MADKINNPAPMTMVLDRITVLPFIAILWNVSDDFTNFLSKAPTSALALRRRNGRFIQKKFLPFAIP
jgi:hypothetical protein